MLEFTQAQSRCCPAALAPGSPVSFPSQRRSNNVSEALVFLEVSSRSRPDDADKAGKKKAQPTAVDHHYPPQQS